MYPLNDKDLDRLSREAAEQYDVPQSTSGWERLQDRLNQELPVREKRRRRFLLLLLAVLITGGGLVYMLTGSPDQQNSIAGKPGKTVVTPEAGQTEGTAVPGESSGAPASTSRGNSADEGEEVVTLNQGEPVNNLPSLPGDHAEQQQAPAHTPTLPDTRKNELRKTDKPSSTKRNIDVANGLAPGLQRDGALAKVKQEKDGVQQTAIKTKKQKDIVIAASEDKNIPATVQPGQEVWNNNDKAAGPSAPKQLTASLPQLSAAFPLRASISHPTRLPVAQEPPAAQKPATPMPAAPVQRFEFGIVAGPDYSHVKNKYFERPGYNIGVTAGYRFSNRWQVNIGIVYAKKYYKTAGEDFKPKYLPPSWEMQLATGNCSMLEIPLNIRYDISYNAKRRFFVSAGASAWLMDSESYLCKVASGSNSYTFPWESDNNTEYLLSNLNFSAGYEKNIGRHFSIQAEPYLKLPVTKVGWGSINLGSYGLLFGLKYKLK